MARLSLLDAALAYARLGLPVFPLRPRDKRPLFRAAHPTGHACRGECGALGHGFHDSTVDPARLTAWWGAAPEANVGLPAGGAFADVLDVDPRNGGDRTLAALVATHGPLPLTRSVLTGGGGRHILFMPDPRVRCGDGVAGPGLDVKARGGYVVAPPSVHPLTGETYEWSVLDVPLAAWPAWLLARILPARDRSRRPCQRRERLDGRCSRYGAVALRTACEVVEASVEGLRHTALRARAVTLGGLAAGGEVAEDLARECLVAAALAAGLSAREARQTVDWGLARGALRPLHASRGGRRV